MSPGDLLLDRFSIGFSKKIKHGAAEIVSVAVGVAQLIGDGIQEQITACKETRQGMLQILQRGNLV